MAKSSAKHRPSKSGADKSLTPAMRQYVEQKKQAGDAILFFRMGDFYETFYDDAKTAARVLGLTLTTRDKGENPIPLAGVPYHALETYLSRMVKAGYKVAISEQVEDPRQARGVVQREVVRIVTPGTLTDDALLDDAADNYLAAACPDGNEVGLAFVELSTGEFVTQQGPARAALDELARRRPAELLLAERDIGEADPLAEGFGATVGGVVTRRAAHWFEPYQAERALHRHFGVSTMEGFGYGRIDAALCAAGAVLEYLGETQKTALGHIAAIRPQRAEQYVQLDAATLRALEIERTLRGEGTSGSLLSAADRTSCPMGSRCLRRWLLYPLRAAEAIAARQEAIAALLDSPAERVALRAAIRGFSDIERIGARLGVGRCGPRDLAGLGRTLGELPGLRQTLEPLAAPLLGELRGALEGLEDLADLLSRAIRPDAPSVARDGGFVAAGFDEQFDRLAALSRDSRQWLADYQKRLVEQTGIPTLKIGYNQVFGYYIEVTHAHRDRVPGEFVRKQTVKNAERYITDELRTFESEVLSAQQRALDRELELFEQLRQAAAARCADLQRAAGAIGAIDALGGLAELAATRGYCRPEIVEPVGEAGVLEIADGRHPVLEQTLADEFVPNDTQLDAEHRLVLITGPNMAGKSTYIRQVALLVLLAQSGSYVPAKRLRWSLVDRVFTRVGAADEIARGQSTFMVEMVETANILNNATRESLVVLDEVGRGTSTFDGLSLAWAITEFIHARRGCRTLFATHYHELTELADLLAGVVNANVAVREWQDEVVFLHKIVPGACDKSYGLHVARMAGVPWRVVDRGKEILAELERNFERQSHGAKLGGPAAGRRDGQLLLFGDANQPLIDRLRELDLESLSPLQAFEELRKLKDQLE